MDYIKYLLQTYSEADDCTKGYPCRLTCISRSKKCRNGLPEELKEPLDRMTGFISRLELKSDNGIDTEAGERLIANMENLNGAQKKALTNILNKYKELEPQSGDTQEIASQKLRQLKALDSALANFVGVAVVPSSPEGFLSPKFDELEAMTDPARGVDGVSRLDLVTNAIENSSSVRSEKKEKGKIKRTFNLEPEKEGGVLDYINNVVRDPEIEVTDEIAEWAYDLLPKGGLLNSSGLGSGREGWSGTDSNGNPVYKKGGNKERGVAVLKRYLEQGGIDPYTGSFVFLKDAELEHIQPMGSAFDQVTGKPNGDQPNNWAWISAGQNRKHGDQEIDSWKSNVLKDVQEGRAKYETKWNKEKEKSDFSYDLEDETPNLIRNAISDPRQAVEGVFVVSELLKAKSKAKKSIENTKDNVLLANTKIEFSAPYIQERKDPKKKPGKNQPNMDENPGDIPSWSVNKNGLVPSQLIAIGLASLPNDEERVNFITKLNELSGSTVNSMNYDEQVKYQDDNGRTAFEKKFGELKDSYYEGLGKLLDEVNLGTEGKYEIEVGGSKTQTDLKGLVNNLATQNYSKQIKDLANNINKKNRKVTSDRVSVSDTDKPVIPPIDEEGTPSTPNKSSSSSKTKRLTSEQRNEKLFDILESSENIPPGDLILIRNFLAGKIPLPELYPLLQKYNLI